MGMIGCKTLGSRKCLRMSKVPWPLGALGWGDLFLLLGLGGTSKTTSLLLFACVKINVVNLFLAHMGSEGYSTFSVCLSIWRSI